jgi:alkylation response protein AidB-like acyl-CoA dehydrogenase
VLHFGSAELKARVAPECLQARASAARMRTQTHIRTRADASGSVCSLTCAQGRKVICLCISEPYAGSDVAALRTTAVKDATGQARGLRACVRVRAFAAR